MTASPIALPAPKRSNHIRQRNLWIALVVLSLVYTAGLAYYASVRRVDGDEGFYTTAARLVWEGKTPYRDFFYQQAPLLPYIYSWIWAVHPRSLLAMRLLSVAFAGATVFLWGASLISVKSLPTKVALTTFIAILLNPYWVSWNAVVKTFSFANLLMTAATTCLYLGLRTSRGKWYFVAGLSLGVCASARSLYGPLIPFVFLWLLFKERRSSRSYPQPWAFFAGAVLGLVPMLLSFAGDPHAFLFNNVQYHGLQAGYLPENGKIVVGYHGLGYTLLAYFGFVLILLLGLHPYFTALVVLALIGALSWLKLRKMQGGPYDLPHRRYLALAFVMLLVYTATAMIPFPPYDQYFVSPMVPFLVPFVAEGLRAIVSSKPKWAIGLAIVSPLLFVFGMRREVWEYSRDQRWQISSYRKVTEAIATNSSPGDTVLSLFPGYVFESGRKYYPGLEDQFSYRIMDKITPETAARYHIVSRKQVAEAISSQVAPIVVLVQGSEYYNNLSADEIQVFHAAVNHNYSLAAKIDDVTVYRRRATAETIAPAP